jgi:hypothetical protein
MCTRRSSTLISKAWACSRKTSSTPITPRPSSIARASRGAIDPCFPAKIGIPHVYNLIQVKHRKKPLDAIFFPMYDVLHSPLVKLTGPTPAPRSPPRRPR